MKFLCQQNVSEIDFVSIPKAFVPRSEQVVPLFLWPYKNDAASVATVFPLSFTYISSFEIHHIIRCCF